MAPESSAGRVEARLAELGLALPETAAPAGTYIPALRSGSQVWTSGQLPFVDGVLPSTGKVGEGEGLIAPQLAQQLAATCVLNALAAVKDVIGDLDRIGRVVKLVGFVASDPSFTEQPGVINGASDLLGEVLGDAGVHVRSAVGVAVLPKDSPVEVELVVELA
ncbi:RidA family protein [Kocuria palustris]|uniref:RidA family protein n=1 Tax=Kocuria palustris TaxID=71999 RepID=UPI0011A34136|nr:RidA family protein [Kocuria palustris]